jgi:hypothetical protein
MSAVSSIPSDDLVYFERQIERWEDDGGYVPNGQKKPEVQRTVVTHERYRICSTVEKHDSLCG